MGDQHVPHYLSAFDDGYIQTEITLRTAQLCNLQSLVNIYSNVLIKKNSTV